MGGRCAVCNTPTQQQCAGCRLVYYCGGMHNSRDWQRHGPMCTMLQDTSLFTATIPRSTPTPWNKGGNVFQAIAFPANEDTPRIITVEWEWAEKNGVRWQNIHMRHLFQPGASIRDKQIHRLSSGATPLPDDSCLVVVINDNSSIDRSPLNRCIFKLTEGKVIHPWKDNVIALRQRPQDAICSRYSSANLKEDLDTLKDYFLSNRQTTVSRDNAPQLMISFPPLNVAWSNFPYHNIPPHNAPPGLRQEGWGRSLVGWTLTIVVIGVIVKRVVSSAT